MSNSNQGNQGNEAAGQDQGSSGVLQFTRQQLEEDPELLKAVIDDHIQQNYTELVHLDNDSFNDRINSYTGMTLGLLFLLERRRVAQEWNRSR
jgi:hypothetical protein